MHAVLMSTTSYEAYKPAVDAALNGQSGGVFDPAEIKTMSIELSEDEKKNLASTPDDLVCVAMVDHRPFAASVPMKEDGRWNYIVVTAPAIYTLLEHHGGVVRATEEEAAEAE